MNRLIGNLVEEIVENIEADLGNFEHVLSSLQR